jgi:hypothetical protein
MRTKGLAIGWLVAAGLALAAASATANGISGVVDAAYNIVDSEESGTEAAVDASGSTAGVNVTATCGTDPSVTFTISSDHPDKISIGAKSAAIAQKQSDNQAVATIGGTSGNWDGDVTLLCEKATVTGTVKVKGGANEGRFTAMLKQCTGPGFTAAQAAEIESLCGGNRSVKGKFDGAAIRRVKVRGRGPAVVD